MPVLFDQSIVPLLITLPPLSIAVESARIDRLPAPLFLTVTLGAMLMLCNAFNASDAAPVQWIVDASAISPAAPWAPVAPTLMDVPALKLRANAAAISPPIVTFGNATFHTPASRVGTQHPKVRLPACVSIVPPWPFALRAAIRPPSSTLPV